MLDSLNNRVRTINSELDHISTKKSMLFNTNVNAARVDKLYEKVLKWQSMANHVPHVVTRLESLKTVHDDSVYLSETLKNTKQQQVDLQELLNVQETLLKQVEQGYIENMANVESNISTLDQRMNELLEKLKLLKLNK